MDDYLPMLDGIRIALELHHYEVEVIQGIPGILDNNIKPDLLLIDYHMPDLDVDNVFKQVKNNSKNPIPIILMSGHVHIEQLAALFSVDDYIAKPFHFDDLLYKIETLLSNSNTKKPLHANMYCHAEEAR